MGSMLYQQGKLGESARRLKHSLKLDPENSQSLLLLGMIELQRGDFAAASSHLKQLVKLGAADATGYGPSWDSALALG